MLPKVKNLSISIELGNGHNPKILKNFVKILSHYLEYNVYRYESLNLIFKGDIIYQLGELLEPLRHWSEKRIGIFI